MKRRDFLQSLTAAPVAGMTALSIWKPAPKIVGIMADYSYARHNVSGNIFEAFKPGEMIWIKGGTYSPVTAKDLLKEWPPSSA